VAVEASAEVARGIPKTAATTEEVSTADEEETTELSVAVYRATTGDYPASPSEWDRYDGFLLPGSLSAAYGNEEWIRALRDTIRTEIVGRRRKCLAVCFGHQILAHSFGERGGKGGMGGGNEEDERREQDGEFARIAVQDSCAHSDETASASASAGSVSEDCIGSFKDMGRASRCPAGFQFGRREFQLTPEGIALFRCSSNMTKEPQDSVRADDANNIGCVAPVEPSESSLQLLYTHGDMVEMLPACAVSLGGNSDVPVQSAAYFRSEAEANRFRDICRQHLPSSLSDGNNNSSANETDKEEDVQTVLPTPFAFTFQAHPEYRSGLGEKTFLDIRDKLKRDGAFPAEELDGFADDAKRRSEEVGKDSLDAALMVGRWLGWF